MQWGIAWVDGVARKGMAKRDHQSRSILDTLQFKGRVGGEKT